MVHEASHSARSAGVDNAPTAELDQRRTGSGLPFAHPAPEPSTGLAEGEVAFAGADQIRMAVAASATAASAWARSSFAQRTKVLFAFHQLLTAHRAELAAIITREHGKVLADADGELQRGIEAVEYACGIPATLETQLSTNVSTNVDVHSLRQPVGVAAVVSPFNFPFMVPMWFTPLAIACGNAVILKPSEQDPSVSIRVAELFAEAGLPAAVLTVLHGAADAVNALIEDPDVASISFVGSTPVARHIYETAAANGKRVQALGGAKNHMVVLPDGDLDAAADAAVSAAYGSAGQRCMAVSVLVAVDPVGDELVSRITERAAGLKTGDGTRNSDLGPLITRGQRDRVASYIDEAAGGDAKVVLDGRDAAIDGNPDGYWMGPTLIDHVKPGMPAYDDEIFGPVLCVVRVASYDEALNLVNNNPYGNGVALFTQNGAAARHFQFEVKAGMVGINLPIPVPAAHFSFGGWKSSLFGDLHAYGPDGIRFFTHGKVVTSRWPQPVGGIDLAFPKG